MDTNNFLGLSSFKNYSYGDLVQSINKLTNVSLFLKEEDIFVLYTKFIASIVNNQDIVLLDGDFSEEEVNHFVGDRENTLFPVDNNFENVEACLAAINHSKSKIIIFTSGTTGRPKEVVHTIDSITRGIKVRKDLSECNWLLAYNPTHMAGLQVFFQAFFNKNMLFHVFGKKKTEIIEIIKTYNVTHISATPTFYKLLFPLEEKFLKVKSVAFGGEKSDEQLYNQIKSVFPNAKLINIYASTEAGSLFRSVDSNIFTVKKGLEKLIKVEENQLYLHISLLGQLDSQATIEKWYATGDLIDVVEEKPLSFRFMSRKSEMINTGGYKVNPNEVEAVIEEIDIVSLCTVYKETNSVLGNILCVDIVLKNDAQSKSEVRKLIKKTLSNKLQSYKIPRKMKFVEAISQTRTGKIKR
jgi:acyl-coenzyme A synthetase/AMP-(fatty) acid ligase